MTRSDRLGVLLIWRSSYKLVPIGKSVGATASNDENPELVEGDQAALGLREKLRNKKQSRSYRKPTQVDWTSSLRRAGEESLRNSAIQLGVSSQDALPSSQVVRGAAKDCLPTV